jgi:hypothetical protein
MMTQQVLEQALQRLQETLGLGHVLTVLWQPSDAHPLSGEVKHQVIYIYEREEEKALATLHHEVVDYYVSKAIEPYQNVLNALIKMVTTDAYQRKEQIVNALVNLVPKIS